MKCSTCGLLEKKEKRKICLRFKKEIKTGEDNGGDRTNCLYYMRKMFDGGELLTDQQHLIIQNQDFRSRKMQGPLL